VFDLFFAYVDGKEVAKVDPASVEWVRDSARRGAPGAWYFLAVAYPKDGIGFEDDAEAFRWSRRAAEQGKAGAQFLLASLYGDGKGMPRDFVQSHFWYSLAAAQIARIAAKNSNDFMDHNIKWFDDDIKKLFKEAADYIEARVEKVALEMNPAQVAEAQRLAREWHEKHLKSD
jgi:TPR repeat protein